MRQEEAQMAQCPGSQVQEKTEIKSPDFDILTMFIKRNDAEKR